MILIRSAALLMFGCLGINTAWGACTLTDANNNVITGPVRVYISNSDLTWSGMFDPAALGNGAEIYRKYGIPMDDDVYVTCTETKSLYGVALLPAGSYSGTRLTGVDGVEAKYCTNSCGAYYPSGAYYSIPAGQKKKITGTSASDYQLSATFIKSGNMTAKGVLSGPFAEWRHGSATGQLLVEFHWQNVEINPTVPTCAVSTPAIAVNLDTVRIADFAGVGSLSSSKDFKIRLTCSGGSAGTYTNVHLTLSDVTQPANTSNVLSLSTDSTATGVGIQIMNNGIVRSYGPDSSARGNINQWKAGVVSTGTGSFEIPLSAQYVQTSETVTVGRANARATFTMSYQ